MIENMMYIRDGLLHGRKPTQEDVAANALFVNSGGHGFLGWNPKQAADNLQSLILRTGIPVPPSDVSVETH
jgi:hypothetical protein